MGQIEAGARELQALKNSSLEGGANSSSSSGDYPVGSTPFSARQATDNLNITQNGENVNGKKIYPEVVYRVNSNGDVVLHDVTKINRLPTTESPNHNPRRHFEPPRDNGQSSDNSTISQNGNNVNSGITRLADLGYDISKDMGDNAKKALDKTADIANEHRLGGALDAQYGVGEPIQKVRNGASSKKSILANDAANQGKYPASTVIDNDGGVLSVSGRTDKQIKKYAQQKSDLKDSLGGRSSTTMSYPEGTSPELRISGRQAIYDTTSSAFPAATDKPASLGVMDHGDNTNITQNGENVPAQEKSRLSGGSSVSDTTDSLRALSRSGEIGNNPILKQDSENVNDYDSALVQPNNPEIHQTVCCVLVLPESNYDIIRVFKVIIQYR